MQSHSPDRIAQLAYQLWQERGCPSGSPEVDWERAVRMLESSAGTDNAVLSIPGSMSATAPKAPAQPMGQAQAGADPRSTRPDGKTASDAQDPPPATPSSGGGADTGSSGAPRPRGKGRTLRRSAI